MTRIAIASCCKIRGHKSQEAQPAWGWIEAADPDLLLLLGDNVYMRQGGRKRWDFKQLETVYQEQFQEPHFASLVARVPFMATWDDHDFGPNDSRGATKDGRPRRAKSRRLFHKYLADAINDNHPQVYCSHTIDDVKVIMLDVRYYKTGLRQRDSTILGKRQERWLWRELEHDSKYTIVGSGTCLEKGAPRDKWSAYRDAYARLREKLEDVERLLFLSGDLHRNIFVNHGGFYEVISSGVGRKEDGKPLNNYGLIDFGTTRVKVTLHGRRASDRIEKRIRSGSWRLY